MDYIVIREPRGRYAASHRCAVVVVDAVSEADAIRQAKKIANFMGKEKGVWSAPFAKPVSHNELLFI